MGKRGGAARPSKVSPPALLPKDMRPSALRKGHPDKPSKPTDSMVLALEAVAPFNAYAEVSETAEEHIIPRKSTTDAQLLGLKPMIELADVKRLQTFYPSQTAKAVRVERKRMIMGKNGAEEITEYAYISEMDRDKGIHTITTDPSVVWRRDSTLLRRARVEQLSSVKVTREAHYSGRRYTEIEEPAVIEIPEEENPEIPEINILPPEPPKK
jgi:hypothetical protein